jgi:hypothetical protein
MSCTPHGHLVVKNTPFPKRRSFANPHPRVEGSTVFTQGKNRFDSGILYSSLADRVRNSTPRPQVGLPRLEGASQYDDSIPYFGPYVNFTVVYSCSQSTRKDADEHCGTRIPASSPRRRRLPASNYSIVIRMQQQFSYNATFTTGAQGSGCQRSESVTAVTAISAPSAANATLISMVSCLVIR